MFPTNAVQTNIPLLRTGSPDQIQDMQATAFRSVLLSADDSMHRSGQPEDLSFVSNRSSAGIRVAFYEQMRAWRRICFALASPRLCLQAGKIPLYCKATAAKLQQQSCLEIGMHLTCALTHTHTEGCPGSVSQTENYFCTCKAIFCYGMRSVYNQDATAVLACSLALLFIPIL